MDEQTERLLLLKRRLTRVLMNIAESDAFVRSPPIAEIAIEEFGRYLDTKNEKVSNRKKAIDMMKSSCARAVCIATADDWAVTVRSINKGRAPKAEADMLAAHCGVKGSEHERDSLHLGFLAGYEHDRGDDQFRVSIDPGMSGTGYTVWQHGERVQGGTIWTRKEDLLREQRR